MEAMEQQTVSIAKAAIAGVVGVTVDATATVAAAGVALNAAATDMLLCC